MDNTVHRFHVWDLPHVVIGNAARGRRIEVSYACQGH